MIAFLPPLRAKSFFFYVGMPVHSANGMALPESLSLSLSRTYLLGLSLYNIILNKKSERCISVNSVHDVGTNTHHIIRAPYIYIGRVPRFLDLVLTYYFCHGAVRCGLFLFLFS